MKKPFEILPLADCPDAIPTLAEWVFSEWNAIENIPLENLAAGFAQNLNRETLPITFIAVVGHRPVGCVSIDAADLPRPDPSSPWLASLYVVEEFRGSGIGTALLRHAQSFARKIGALPLHLWTSRNSEFFQREGWIETGRTRLSGTPVTLMRLEAVHHNVPPKTIPPV